jgi:hypothetical protein
MLPILRDHATTTTSLEQIYLVLRGPEAFETFQEAFERLERGATPAAAEDPE